MRFDQSGAYLCVAGTDLRVYDAKSWEQLLSLTDHSATVTGVGFGKLATSIYSVSMDRTVRMYAAPE